VIKGSEKSEVTEIISLITACVELIVATIKIYFDAKEKNALKVQVKELADKLALLENEKIRSLSERDHTQVVNITVNYLGRK
jgi:hypothetical protein